MHSKMYTALARAADERGSVVVGFLEVPYGGTEKWIEERLTTVAVMLEVPEYTAKAEPSYIVARVYLTLPVSADPSAMYAVNPDDIFVKWADTETRRLPRREALAEFTVRAIRAMNP